MHTFLSVGFSPSAALVTWQLENSNEFTTNTYWPTHTVNFNTKLYGNHVFQPNQLDLNAVRNPKPFDFILLVIPSVKEVARMVRKIEKFAGKHTQVLIEVSDGYSTLQRLVRSHLSVAPVSGFLCDIPCLHIPNTETNVWQVLQWGDVSSPGPHLGIHIEPIYAKTLGPIEQALTKCGLPTSHPSNAAGFGAIQWERNIFCLIELCSVVFNIASISELVQSVVSRPVLEGAIKELHFLGNASGVKLPPPAQFLQQAHNLVRRPPDSFELDAARFYYDYYIRANLHLDLLLLIPILLASDLKRPMQTPFLESVYAFATTLQGLNSKPSVLLKRSDEPQEAPIPDDAELQELRRNFQSLEIQLSDRDAQLGEQFKKLSSLEEQLVHCQDKISAKDKQIAQVIQENKRLADMERRASPNRLPPAAPQPIPQTPQAQQNGFQPQSPPDRMMSGRVMPKYGSRPSSRQALQSPPQLQQQYPQEKLPFRRGHSMVDFNQYRNGNGVPPQPQVRKPAPVPEDIDMMSMTRYKNPPGSRKQSMRGGIPSLTSVNGGNSFSNSFSNSFQLDGIANLASQDAYGIAARTRLPPGVSHDNISSHRPFSHGPGLPRAPSRQVKQQIHQPLQSADFSNFGYNYENPGNSANKLSPTSGSVNGSLSGNSRSTPPRSPSVTPPTPHTSEAVLDMQKEQYRFE